MSEFKEFQGKTLDEAIQAACEHYDMPRAKLEIEIISGGSTGIFGLVGVRKASVKARPRGGIKAAFTQDAPRKPKQTGPQKTDDSQASKPDRQNKNNKPEQQAPKKKQTGAGADSPRQPRDRGPETVDSPSDPVQEQRLPEGQDKPQYPPRKPVHDANPAPVPADRDLVPDFPEDEAEAAPEQDTPAREAEAAGNGTRPPLLEGLDKEELEAVVREAALKLLQSLSPDPKLEITVKPDRVHVMIDDEEHSGLIIGREGQTLSALQYLINRIVSRRMETAVRVQLDTGDYRERQDEKLRAHARRLAEKAIKSKRTQSTKPMSSYHRRVVHLTVQEMPGVLTRSKGEGPLKRVLILPKRRSR
jgi:spoIIIJ-associated protein